MLHFRSCAFSNVVVDPFEGVSAWLPDLRSNIFERRHVELIGRLGISHRKLVERPDPMPEPLTRYEDRTADVKTKTVVFERRSMPFAHQESDQAFIGFVHDLFATGETDPRRIDNR